jgi:hypothetical protein
MARARDAVLSLLFYFPLRRELEKQGTMEWYHDSTSAGFLVINSVKLVH